MLLKAKQQANNVVPKGFWSSLRNQQVFLDRVGAALGVKEVRSTKIRVYC